MPTSYIQHAQYGKILFLTRDIWKCRGIMEPFSPKCTLAAILEVFVLSVNDSLNVRCTFDTSRCIISRKSVVLPLNLVFLPVELNQPSFKYDHPYRLVKLFAMMWSWKTNDRWQVLKRTVRSSTLSRGLYLVDEVLRFLHMPLVVVQVWHKEALVVEFFYSF